MSKHGISQNANGEYKAHTPEPIPSSEYTNTSNVNIGNVNAPVNTGSGNINIEQINYGNEYYDVNPGDEHNRDIYRETKDGLEDKKQAYNC